MVTFLVCWQLFCALRSVGGGPFVVAGRLGGVGGIEVFSDFFAKYTVYCTFDLEYLVGH
jgi:hypothetical protein